MGTDAFDDADELGKELTNPRASDTRALSTKQEAKAIVRAFYNSSAHSPWVSLSRWEVGSRLEQLIETPEILHQGRLNLCGPAAFFSAWARRDPKAFARFATTLFDRGEASINGRFPVKPNNDLILQDYSAMRAKMGIVVTQQADWMIMGALRNNDDAVFVWVGDPTQEVAGMTYPEEIVKWLTATGLYSSIDNQVGNVVEGLFSKGYNAAERLEVREGCDIFCLIQANTVASKINAGIASGFLAAFPNHWVRLIGPVSRLVTTGRVSFPLWSFGRDWTDVDVSSAEVFADNFYGAIVGKMR